MARIRYVPVLVALAVVLGGCGDTSPSTSPGSTVSQSEGPSAEPTPTPTPTPTPSPSPSPPSTNPTGSVAVAVADLASRLGKSEAEIEVVSQEEVTWPDASLGCPEPDMMYAQVLTPGERIVLRAGGKTYEYHSGRHRGPFLCENPTR